MIIREAEDASATVDQTTLNSKASTAKDKEEALAVANLSPEDQVQEYMNEFLSASRLQSLTGTLDLSKVKYLELKIDVRKTSLAGLGESLPSLEQLKLNNSYIPSIRDLGSNYVKLNVLWMARSHLNDLDGLSSLSRSGNLKELYFAYNCVQDLSNLGFVDELEVVDLEGNCVADFDQVENLALCQNLISVTLEGNPIMYEEVADELRELTERIVNANEGEDDREEKVIELDEEVVQRYRLRVKSILPTLMFLDDVAFDVGDEEMVYGVDEGEEVEEVEEEVDEDDEKVEDEEEEEEEYDEMANVPVYSQALKEAKFSETYDAVEFEEQRLQQQHEDDDIDSYENDEIQLDIPTTASSTTVEQDLTSQATDNNEEPDLTNHNEIDTAEPVLPVAPKPPAAKPAAANPRVRRRVQIQPESENIVIPISPIPPPNPKPIVSRPSQHRPRPPSTAPPTYDHFGTNKSVHPALAFSRFKKRRATLPPPNLPPLVNAPVPKSEIGERVIEMRPKTAAPTPSSNPPASTSGSIRRRQIMSLLNKSTPSITPNPPTQPKPPSEPFESSKRVKPGVQILLRAKIDSTRAERAAEEILAVTTATKIHTAIAKSTMASSYRISLSNDGSSSRSGKYSWVLTRASSGQGGGYSIRPNVRMHDSGIEDANLDKTNRSSSLSNIRRPPSVGEIQLFAKALEELPVRF